MSRSETFPPDGHRLLAEPKYIVAFARKYSFSVPAQYFLATADHESSFTLNEIDTEPNGFKSYGIYQISDEELSHAQYEFEKKTQQCLPRLDLLKLDDASRVMALLAEERLDTIVTAAGLMKGALPPDVWFFLSLAHNEGMGACLKTIRAHGLDAKAWTERNKDNPSLAQAARYFNDCITGGPHWDKSFEGDWG